MCKAFPVMGMSSLILPPQQLSVRLIKPAANGTVEGVTCGAAAGVVSRVWDACCNAKIIKVGDIRESDTQREHGKPERSESSTYS